MAKTYYSGISECKKSFNMPISLQENLHISIKDNSAVLCKTVYHETGNERRQYEGIDVLAHVSGANACWEEYKNVSIDN